MMSQKGTDIALCQLFGFQTYGRTNTVLVFYFIIREPNLKFSQQALNSELKKNIIFFYFVYISKAQNKT